MARWVNYSGIQPDVVEHAEGPRIQNFRVNGELRGT